MSSGRILLSERVLPKERVLVRACRGWRRTMPFQHDVIERMLLSKSLLGPIRFLPTARPDRLTLARHILTAHDAAELALAGIAQHLGRWPRTQQVHLMDYFPAIEEV